LVLAALLMGVGFVLLPLITPAALAPPASTPPSLAVPSPAARAWFGAVLIAACGAYCIGLWSGGRRTLPMKTWRLQLRTEAGFAPSLRTAAVRFLACWIGPILGLAVYVALRPQGLGGLALAVLALNYAWVFVDRERLFLQDRLAGTRLITQATP
jgi:uncharacterized RDD family membrane protein YckC